MKDRRQGERRSVRHTKRNMNTTHCIECINFYVYYHLLPTAVHFAIQCEYMQYVGENKKRKNILTPIECCYLYRALYSIRRRTTCRRLDCEPDALDEPDVVSLTS